MHAAEIRRAVDAAPRSSLPEITALLWQAFAAGHVDEAQAEELHAAIEARQTPSLPTGRSMTHSEALPTGRLAIPCQQDRAASSRSRLGSRPHSEASLARRRRWAASGRLPPGIAARFTLAEQAALAVIAAETAKRGDCRLAVGHIAALAGVSETSVRNALREARRHGLVTVEERRASAWRNLPNVVRIVSAEWVGWLRLARARPSTMLPGREGGCKSPNRTDTVFSEYGRSAPQKPSRQTRFSPAEERRAM